MNNKIVAEKQVWSILENGDILTIGTDFICVLVDPDRKEDGFNLQGRISQAIKYVACLRNNHKSPVYLSYTFLIIATVNLTDYLAVI